ncbi:MAG: hypothetical protein WBW92_12495 [Rhodanobacteraceae bacterium]
MSKTIHIACPNCEALNRVPSDRMSAAPACGKCHLTAVSGRATEG